MSIARYNNVTFIRTDVNLTFDLVKYVSCNNFINNFIVKNITDKIALLFPKVTSTALATHVFKCTG